MMIKWGERRRRRQRGVAIFAQSRLARLQWVDGWVTKGMVVGRTRDGAVHVGALNMPCGALINDSIVIAFVVSSWSATKGITHILLLDSIQRFILLRLGRGQVGRGY